MPDVHAGTQDVSRRQCEWSAFSYPMFPSESARARLHPGLRGRVDGRGPSEFAVVRVQ